MFSSTINDVLLRLVKVEESNQLSEAAIIAELIHTNRTLDQMAIEQSNQTVLLKALIEQLAPKATQLRLTLGVPIPQ